MRILALSDIHGAFEIMRKIIAAERTADLIILAGDLTTRGSTNDLEDVLAKARAFHKPLLTILGNMDPPGLQAFLDATGTSLNGSGVSRDGVGFFGVSASPYSPLHTPNEVPDEDLGRIAEKGWQLVKKTRWKILVAHTPPFESVTDRLYSGAHAGSPSLRRFVDSRQPDLVICGHIHEARGKDVIGASQVVNCGPAFEGSYAVIELGEVLDVRLVP